MPPAPRASILIVDDEASIRESLRMVLEFEGYRIEEAGTGVEALRIVRDRPPDTVLLDIRMPEMDGLDAFRIMRERGYEMPVIFISGHADVASAVEATRRGAFDFLEKPPDSERLRLSVRNAVEAWRLRRDAGQPASEAGETSSLVGSSAVMQRLRETIALAAPAPATVLITGESGTGKELVARAIHEQSGRRDGLFVQVNCAAIPEELIESELFGHEKGSFTGAVRKQTGKFVAADGGTIFLDEVGDMSARTQAKVLRVLESGDVEPVGAEKTIRVDVRVVAATNRLLEEEIRAGRFREDLFYRLNVLSIHMPPLRAREDDIELLARFFLQKFAHELSRPVAGLRESALAAMRNHSWPGNVRELISVIRRAVVMADRRWLSAADLGMPTPHTLRLNRASVPTLAEARREAEVTCIRQAMEASSLNIQSAARNLGVSRVTLYRLLEKYSIMPIKESGMNHGPDTQEGQTETQIRGSAS